MELVRPKGVSRLRSLDFFSKAFSSDLAMVILFRPGAPLGPLFFRAVFLAGRPRAHIVSFFLFRRGAETSCPLVAKINRNGRCREPRSSLGVKAARKRFSPTTMTHDGLPIAIIPRPNGALAQIPSVIN